MILRSDACCPDEDDVWNPETINLGTGMRSWGGAPPITPRRGWIRPPNPHKWLEAPYHAEHTSFNTTFIMSKDQLDCAALNPLQFAADDTVLAVRLNHHQLQVPQDQGYWKLASLEVPVSVGLFVAGENVLHFDLLNRGGSGGLLVQGAVRLECLPPPAPPPWHAEKVRACMSRGHFALGAGEQT